MTSLHSVAHPCAVSKASHYPSLELCRKLTEIGFPDTENVRYEDDKKGIWYNSPECDPWDFVCPSVMEMLDVMPSSLAPQKEAPYLTFSKHSIQYEARKEHCDITDWDEKYISLYDKGLPNALAEMILWLHENNYISFNK